MSTQALRDAVARQVMGWTLVERNWAYSDRAEVWQDDAGVVVLTRFAWRPDEDDAQSMQVLDRLTSLGFATALHVDAGGSRVEIQRDGARLAATSTSCRRQALLCAAASLERVPGG